MGKRRQISAETVSAVAAENAGHPLERRRAEQYAVALEPILDLVASLRTLPLKDIEPAIKFVPQELIDDG